MDTTLVAVHNQPAPTSRRAFGVALFLAMAAPVAIAAAEAPRTLFYMGGNLGLGEPMENCFFMVQEHGQIFHWSILETFARFNEFSEAAKAKIVMDCQFQLQHS